MQSPRIYEIHDQALTIEFSTIISEESHLKVMQWHALLNQHPFKGFIESVPAYSSLTVYFDEEISSQEVKSYVIQLLEKNTDLFSSSTVNTSSTKHIIPVCYDPSYGLDIVAIAEEKNLSIDEIIAMHTSQTFRVYMIGFVPGFAYMGTLPDVLETKRKNIPRLEVPKGSVGIAGLQTGIYPSTIPGGWNILGRTPINLFNKTKEPCSFLQAGDLVQFQSITKEAFEQYP
ncbi:MAG: 5-oxoprolinase subunit PxpB [Bacteroidota bacterium]